VGERVGREPRVDHSLPGRHPADRSESCSAGHLDNEPTRRPISMARRSARAPEWWRRRGVDGPWPPPPPSPARPWRRPRKSFSASSTRGPARSVSSWSSARSNRITPAVPTSAQGHAQRHPWGCRGPASTLPPAAADPLPQTGQPVAGQWRTSDAVIEDLGPKRSESRTAHVVAWAWRTTFVSPSRSTKPKGSDYGSRTSRPPPGRSAATPGRPEELPPRGELPGQLTSR